MVRKVYVEVTAKFDTEGNITPLSVTWEDGTIYEIDKVVDKRRAASLKAGGIGMRYTCRILNQESYLFYEEPRWFVAAKRNVYDQYDCSFFNTKRLFLHPYHSPQSAVD